MSDIRAEVASSLRKLNGGPTKLGATELLQTLGYVSRKTVELDGSVAEFLAFADPANRLQANAAARVGDWKGADFLFQLTNDELPILAQGNRDLFQGEEDYRTSIIESFVFLAIELNEEHWTRGSLAAITREVNRLFPMPVLILFRHGSLASFSVIDRRENKRDSSRDVIEKRISIVKDIDLRSPHRAHIDILCDIALEKLSGGRGAPNNFRDLYNAWMNALSAQLLNERFYRQLANWFLWSTKLVVFPSSQIERGTSKRDEQNQIGVIRLLTRLIFVWFVKEKGLVPNELFDLNELRDILKDDPLKHPDDSAYYKAILQNLFFATLNTEMSDDRKWRTKARSGGLDGQYLVHTVYRYRDKFRDPDRGLELFRQIPFLNGGLFECLDREVTAKELERNPDLASKIVREGSHSVIRIDGYSERPDNALAVPNKIFFAKSEKVDLNEEYQTKGRVYEAIGLIELFSHYKFTVEENTPVEEEVALDPELLGKVFENLLASYNADTRVTARKKSGSFYTPRVVVSFMVDEALITYFTEQFSREIQTGQRKPIRQALDLGAVPGELDLDQPKPKIRDGGTGSQDLGKRLRDLLSFHDTGNPFSDRETDLLISAIDRLKALDPACGSGAFPMGMLQKLIHILHRLDPDNARWKRQNRRPLEMRLKAAQNTPDPSRRESEIEEAEAALIKLDHDFSDANKPDYARKLYLIDKCLFGVDLQPIAVQIAKLRFFISLVVSQEIDRSKDNANITALPNLETKLVAANSLIPIERAAQTDLFRNDGITDKEDELRLMNARYFGARTAKTKRTRRNDIARLRDELAVLLKSDRGLPEEDARKMATWDPFDQNASATFFDPEWMFGLSSKFDVVIGNPPYVRHESIKDQKPLLERYYGGKDSAGSPVGAYSGTADLFVYFIQRGFELLNPGGAFAYITSNKWYRAKYGERLREWVNRYAQLLHVIDFGDAEVFDAMAYPTILIAKRRPRPVRAPAATDVIKVMNWPDDRDRSEVEGFPDLVEAIGFEVAQKDLSAKSWQLEPKAKRNLLDQIRAAGLPLGQYVEGRLYYGIKTGFNDAFVIDEETKEQLIAEDESSAAIIKPFLRGRDIKRWKVESENLWLIFTRRGTDIGRYPAIQSYLTQYREKLEPKPSHWSAGDGAWRGRKAGSYKWYEIQDNVAYWEEFEQPKIIVPAIQNKVDYAPDLAGYYSNDKTSIIVDSRWPFLLGVLNSTVSWWLTQQTFASRAGGFYEFKPMYVSQLPIPKASAKQQQLIETIVSWIVSRVADPRLEQLLNGFVYELFFPEALHARQLRIFDEVLENSASTSADAFAESMLQPGGRLRAMLSDLQTLDIVRIVEGRT